VKKVDYMSNLIVTIGIPVMPHREHYIDQCLQSVIQQDYQESYEVLIVQHPGFKYQIKLNDIPRHISIKRLDSEKSLSQKRNDIIKYAKGDYIINIDDDVIAEHDWLGNMMHAVKQNDYDIFWGSAKPIYEKEFPRNLESFEMLIGGFHFDRKGNLRRKGLIGCNFGFRKGLLHKRGKFVESIGRGGKSIISGEETLFLAECINPKIGFICDSTVNHYIQIHRINFRYIVKNRCSNVRARIFINGIIGNSNIIYFISRIKMFVKAFYYNKQFLKNIYLEYSLLKTTFFSIITNLIKKDL